MAKVYGIDLGTTYSCIARCDENGIVDVISDVSGVQYVTPSVIHFDHGNGKPTVGNEPKECLKVEGEADRILAFVKRSVGEDYCPNEILVGDKFRKVSPVEGSAIILHHMLTIANRDQFANGENEIKDAVITIPAGFTNKQRECTKIAAELAGINVLGLIHEPTAAAVSSKIGAGETVLVFDLGGGTLDVSIVKSEVTDGKCKYTILGVASDYEVHGHYIGGKDWDELLIDYCIDDIGYPHENRSREQDGQLRLAAEACKKSLTGRNQSTFVCNAKSVMVKRTDFERLSHDLLEECTQVVEKAISKAEELYGESNVKINRFLLVGGSSNMPMIRMSLKRRFEEKYGAGRNERQWLCVADPEMAIAKGAAKYAQMLLNGQAENDKILIEERSQHSYGTSVQESETGNYFICNLIRSSENMVVESHDINFFTVNDGQQGITVDVYENSIDAEKFPFDDDAKNNKEIYNRSYKFNHPVPKRTCVTFNVKRDKDGIISIKVKSPGHNEETHTVATVNPPISDTTREQIKKSVELMDQEYCDTDDNVYLKS